MLAAIVLAAGASERMGYPKALLQWQGEPFLKGILAACYAAGVERRIVVLGHDAGRILDALGLEDVSVIHSTDLDAGPIGSIRAGIIAVRSHPFDGLLVWPVDRPHVQVATVEALLAGFRAGTHPIVVPRYGGRRGHPVVFGRAVFPELVSAVGDSGARAVVRAVPERVLEVAVDDPAVVQDVNTPDEYEALVRRTGAVD